MNLPRKALLRLAAESGADPRTIERLYAGEATKGATRERVAKAAKKLRIAQPPENA